MAESGKKTEEAIFYMALEKSPEERRACLEEVCGEDSRLLGRVEALLKAREIEDDFLRAPVLDPDTTLDNSPPREGPGTVIGRYKLLERIGEGGMAVVYMAEQTRPLQRKVALKIIKLGMDTRQVIARFEAERQALAMMDHPNIAKVLDAGATDTGRPYFVMELVKGISITEYCDKNRLGTSERMELFIQVCNAVQHAHQKAIVHRDIKPTNVMVTLHDGRPVPKVIDFGIAKAMNQRLTEKTLFTRYAQMIGTPAYMSPEQAEMSGLDVDTRTDIYSLGVLLYELLTGTTPFDGERLRSAGYLELQRIIREENPTKPSTKLSSLTDRLSDIARYRHTQPDVLAKSIRGDLDWIVMKSLEKDRTRRYETVHALAEDVQRHLNNQPILARRPSVVYRLHKFCRRNRYKLAVATVIIVLVAGILVSVATHLGNLKVDWARTEALPRIAKLVERGDYLSAFFLAAQAKKYVPEDPVLLELWPQISRPYTVRTDPAGADVYYKEYSDLEGEWLYLGRSPLESIRFPRGVYRWKLAKEGFETRECGIGGLKDLIIAKLQPQDDYPEMVFIPSKRHGDYLMDKYEVTNEQFKKFVDAGGYTKREYWEHQFVKYEREISWDEAMREFRDKTGRPGPASWEGSSYLEGKENHPVSGISWYEASAYARFAGKSLPTTTHWYGAARCHAEADVIIPHSNFGRSPAPVGSFHGVGLTGLHDMAGNIREWCFNAVDDSGAKRYILGGAYDDPEYMFSIGDTADPWDRSGQNGFRCAKYLVSEDSLAKSLFEPIEVRPLRDISQIMPPSNEEFRTYKQFYAYDNTELKARSEWIDNSATDWRKEKISLNAAYGNERVVAYLFIPKQCTPPYQPIVFFPTANACRESSSENLRDISVFGYIVQSGRAVIYPVYKGTYERILPGQSLSPATAPIAHRSFFVQIFQDLARTVDYLETRDDMDLEKLTYFGASRGGWTGPLWVALEDRMKAAIFTGGGCWIWMDAPIPSADPMKFAPRVKVPTLMLNGRYDSIFPYDTSQKPLFDFLGTPDEHKVHKTYRAGHIVRDPSGEKDRPFVIEWLDKYLGPVDVE